MALSALPTPTIQTAVHLPRTPWWGAWSGFLIVGCFYVTQAVGISIVQLVATLGMGNSSGVDGASALDQTWFLPMSLLAGTIGGALVALRVAASRAKLKKDSEWVWEFIWQSYDVRRLWRFVFLGLGLGLGFFSLTEYGVLPPDDLPQPIFDALLAASVLLQLVWILMFVVLFPVIEEILFRGILLTGLTQSWGPILAAIVTTALFVAVHMPKVLEYWPALVAVICIGALAVVLRIRTGSLAPGIVMHCAYNGTLVTAAFLPTSVS